MKSRTIAIGTIASIVLMMLLICTAPAFAQIAEPHNADAMWIEPSINTFDVSNTNVGFKFNVTVALNFTENAFAWQAVIYYNSTQLNCTRVGPTAPPSSDFMTGHSTTFTKAINPGSYPPVNGTPPVHGTPEVNATLQAVLVAETCSSPDFVPGPHSGTLFWAEFQILLAPSSGNLTSAFNMSWEYTLTNVYVWDETGTPINFTANDGTYNFVPEFGPLMIAIFMTSTLAAVILSKNRLSKRTKIDSN
jgi:hypothetical protein